MTNCRSYPGLWAGAQEKAAGCAGSNSSELRPVWLVWRQAWEGAQVQGVGAMSSTGGGRVRTSSAFIGRLFLQMQSEAQIFLETGRSVSFKPLSLQEFKY